MCYSVRVYKTKVNTAIPRYSSYRISWLKNLFRISPFTLSLSLNINRGEVEEWRYIEAVNYGNLNECLDCTAWGKITCDRRWKPTQPINKFEKQWEGDRNRSWLSIFNHLHWIATNTYELWASKHRKNSNFFSSFHKHYFEHEKHTFLNKRNHCFLFSAQRT